MLAVNYIFTLSANFFILVSLSLKLKEHVKIAV